MARRTLLLCCSLFLFAQSSCLYRKPWFDDALVARTPPNLPALPTGPALRVLVLGDFGTGGSGQKETARAVAKTHASLPPHLVLTVGDNFYPRGVQSTDDPLWETVFEETYSGPFWEGLVFFPILGNHDVEGNWTAQVDYSAQSRQWNMPGEFFSFREPLPSGDTARFLALDTNPINQRSEEMAAQVEWVDSTLENQSDRWIIAYGHHPMATGGWHGVSEAVRDTLSPRFEGKVPLYLSGHNHSIELLKVSDGLLQAVCGGGAGRDNAYRVDDTPETLSAFSNGGWCFLHIWSDTLAIELYNRAGTLRFRHLVAHPEAGGRG